MSNPNDPAEPLKWFYEHCASHHYLLDTKTSMLDVAVTIMDHIHQLNILFVSNKVKADLVRCLANVTNIQMFEGHLYVYIEGIAVMLLELMARYSTTLTFSALPSSTDGRHTTFAVVFAAFLLL